MKLKHLPFETKEALKTIKDIKGFDNNNVVIAYCVAVTANYLKDGIIADMRFRTEAAYEKGTLSLSEEDGMELSTETGVSSDK